MVFRRICNMGECNSVPAEVESLEPNVPADL